MTKLILIAVSVYFAQGCAFATGFTEGIIEQAGAPRPSMSDPLHASGPAAPAFGRAVIHAPPTNLPLPKSANPAEYFRVPDLNSGTRSALFGTIDGTVEILCSVFSGMYGSSDPECHRGPRRDGIRNIRSRPAINR